MQHTFLKISKLINVKDCSDFFNLISKLDTSFFENTFHKSKSSYLTDIKNLAVQLDEDFHYVHILKRKSHVFQLQWKESVLLAHLRLITPQLPKEYIVEKPLYKLRVV